MSYLGQPPRFGDYPVKTFTGNGSLTSFSLDHSVPSDASIIVFIDGVRQHVGSYSAAGTAVLDFGSGNAPANLASIEVVHLGLEATLNTPAALSVATGMIIDDAVTADKLANSINTEIAANTAKVTNATHTGDVTGATALTIATDAVDIAMLSATGTASATTFLRGDNSWNALSEYNDTAVRNDIATLALHTAISDNKAAYNLSNAFIDQFESDAGLDNQTNVDRVGDPEYMSSVTSTSVAYHINSGGFASKSSGAADPVFSLTNNERVSFGASTGSSGFSLNNQSGINSGLFTFEQTLVQLANGGAPNSYGVGVMKNNAAMIAYTGNTYSAFPSGTHFTISSAVGHKIKTVYDTDTPNAITTYYDSGSGYGSASTSLSTIGANWTDAITTLYFMFVSWSDGAADWRWDTTGTRVYGTTSATGSFTSATQTALASVSTMGIVVLYKNNAGTATLNTGGDLIVEVSANGGTNYTNATLVAGGAFSTGINIAAVSGVSVTAGTAPKYRISFANQASGSKETQVHGVALLY